MVATMGEPETSSDEIVQVAVPKHLLAQVYRVLADNMAPPTGSDGHLESEFPVTVQKTKQNMIDLIVEVAWAMGVNQHPVSLRDLHTTYLGAYPGISKGNFYDSFAATVNFYTINMRSRFPDHKDRRKPASWLSQPTFKRVARGQYMLLSEDEIDRFLQCVAQNDPMVYEDEYDVADLIP